MLQENGFEVDVVKIIEKGPKFINELKDETKEINQRLGGYRRRKDADKEKIDENIQTFKKYRNYLNKTIGGMDLIFGKGLKDLNKLCERLNSLVSAKQAGNNNNRLDKEISSILNKLKSSKCISHCKHQKLSSCILK